MPNLKRANRWPNNLLEDIFIRKYNKYINDLPADIDKSIEYLLSRLHPNQRQVLLWFYKDGYTMKEMTKLEGNFTYHYILKCKDHGVKNMVRLSYILIIGYDNFIKGHKIMEWPISLLVEDLKAISYNALERAGIYTVGDILQYSKAELMLLDRVHEITIRKVDSRLKDYNLSIRD